MALITITRPSLAGQTGLTIDLVRARHKEVLESGVSLTEGATGVFTATVSSSMGGYMYLIVIKDSSDDTVETLTYSTSSPIGGGLSVSAGKEADGGYEFTAGFADRTTGTGGASDVGSNVSYTQDMVNNDRWLRFGFDSTQQATNDVAYWTEPTPASTAGVGLFGGSYMPSGVTSMFDFDFNASTYSDAVETGDFQYTAADGSLDFSQCVAGDLALVRFDFNVLPQIANTTLEVALIWQTRLSDGTPTFTFALTGDPMFYGTGTVGRTFLARPMISAYFASQEDVNARALLAIRADNPIQIQPLTTLTTIQR
jgi:hypothetical protein